LLGADDATSDITFAIAISAGGVAVATVLAIWLKTRADKKKKNGEGK
jgi:hypothetical protein